MRVVNIRQAKTHLSRLLEAVERGEDVVIARAGQPVATLKVYRPACRWIAPPGSMKGRDWPMADDFDAPVDELFSCLHEPEGETGKAQRNLESMWLVEGLAPEFKSIADFSKDSPKGSYLGHKCRGIGSSFGLLGNNVCRDPVDWPSAFPVQLFKRASRFRFQSADNIA